MDTNSSNSPQGKSPEPTESTRRLLGEGFRLPLWLKFVILAVVVALAAVGYKVSQWSTQPLSQRAALEPADAEEIASRKPVQDFILTEESGATKKLSDLKGNVVILSFWASWCGPCLAELPTFAELEKKFGSQGLRVVPVNVDDGDDGRVFAKDFWSKKSLPFTTYYDVKKDLANQFEVNMLPSTFVIDRQGRLVFSSAGASDWTSQDTQDLIESVLHEPQG